MVAHLKELSEIDRTVAMFRRYPELQVGGAGFFKKGYGNRKDVSA